MPAVRRLVSRLRLCITAVLIGCGAELSAQSRTPEQVALPQGMTGTAVLRLDRLENAAPPAAREALLTGSGLSVWLLQNCGLPVQEAVSITVGSAGAGAVREPFFLISARGEVDLDACARATGAQIEAGKELGSWPSVVLRREGHPPRLLARVSSRSLVTMKLPPADEAWLRGAVERIAAVSRVREAVANESECIAFVRCAEGSEIAMLFPPQTPFLVLLEGVQGVSGRLTASNDKWTADLKTIYEKRPAAVSAAERWKRWCSIALPDADTEANDSGALCDVKLEMTGADLAGLMVPLPPESRIKTEAAADAGPGTPAPRTPATNTPREGDTPAVPATVEKMPPASLPVPPSLAPPGKVTPPEPAPVEKPPEFAASGPEPDNPPLTGDAEIMARRRAQSLAAAFNGGVAARGLDAVPVRSLTEAISLLRKGVHGAGRHAGLVFQVTTTEGEGRDAARYLRLEGGVLRYLPPASR